MLGKPIVSVRTTFGGVGLSLTVLDKALEWNGSWKRPVLNPILNR